MARQKIYPHVIHYRLDEAMFQQFEQWRMHRGQTRGVMSRDLVAECLRSRDADGEAGDRREGAADAGGGAPAAVA